MQLLWKDFTLAAQDFSKDLDLSQLVRDSLNPHQNLVGNISIHKKSLDARMKSKIVYRFQMLIESKQGNLLRENFPFLEPLPKKTLDAAAPRSQTCKSKTQRHKPSIIGSGPAGIFAALALKQANIACQIVERGERVEERFRTVGRLRKKGILDPESNFCFGEGGAGAFSDGKLSCGRNHPLIEYIFSTFAKFGAPKDILYGAHPHIGTDYLMRIALNMRKSLQESGSDFKFGKIFTGFREGSKSARYIAMFNDGEEIPCDHLILAIGHSARDTYQRLFEANVAMAPKPFAIGARIEHPQELINQIQFGGCQIATSAEYKLTARANDRGIWTFCMCPGGHLLPTPAQAGHLAINGMSYHSRNSGFANAAVVVNILREDFYKGHVLDGMHFQEELEKKAFVAGGSNYHSPAQRLVDFLASRDSQGAMHSTYLPGINPARMDHILPPFVTEALKVALYDYNKRMRGYLSEQALIVGLESKTSAPVTMLRDKDLQSISHPGLFPCGEGAGFAGGIISAALDGIKVGQALARLLDPSENDAKESAEIAEAQPAFLDY